MKKFIKGVSAALAMTLTVGLFTGCAGKTKNVTFDYNADDYVKVGQYKGLEVSVDDFTVTDDDLQDVIDQILNSYLDYHIVDRPAQEGDQVLLSFDAYISGSKVEGFSSDDYELVIGSGDFLVDGFEEAMIGLSAGDSRAITGLKVPDDFTAESKYAGRAITFNIDVAGVYEPAIPVYADDFVTEITNGEFTTVDAYNKELMRMLEENAETNRYNDKYNKLLDQIVSGTEVIKDFPAEYVDEKVQAIKTEMEKYLPLYDMSEEEYLLKYYGVKTPEEVADSQIRLEFIFQSIINQENITVTEKYYKDHLSETADLRNYTNTDKFVDAYTENGAVKCMLLDKAEKIIVDSAVEK